jgi:hypothetical protein
MIKILMIILPMISFAQDSCDSLFEAREKGQSFAEEALFCYEKELESAQTRTLKAHCLNRMGYLKFFIAEYFLDDKFSTLYEGMELSEKSVLLFGPKYSLADYRTLTPEESKILAIGLYNYGLNTARYIDISGTVEALKRMGDIKRSMSSIMRIKEDSVAHYGAHRTMGIFHTKVPAIAGGEMSTGKELLIKALEMTKTTLGVSSYPANNIAYSDWLYKSGKTEESCAQLKHVSELEEKDVRSLNNGLFFESMMDVKKAKGLLVERECSI